MIKVGGGELQLNSTRPGGPPLMYKWTPGFWGTGESDFLGMADSGCGWISISVLHH